MPKKKSLQEAGIIGARVISTTLATVAIQYLLIKNLSAHDYGLVTWGATVLSFLSVLSLPGLSNAIPGAVANGYIGNYTKGTKQKVRAAIYPFAGLLVIAAYTQINSTDKYTAWFYYALAACTPGVWLDTWQAYWTGTRNFRLLTISTSASKAAQVLLTYIATSCAPFAHWAILANQGVLAAANVLITKHTLRGIGKDQENYSEKFASFSASNTKLYVIGTITSQIDKLIIGIFIGMNQLATYAIAELIYQYAYVTPKSLLEQFYISKLSTRSPRDAIQLVTKVQVTIACFLVPIAILAIMLSGHIIFPSLELKHPGLQALAIIFLLTATASLPLYLIGAVLKGHAMIKSSEHIQYISSGTPLILNAPACIFWGIEGLAWSRLVQAILVACFCLRLTHQLSKSPQ